MTHHARILWLLLVFVAAAGAQDKVVVTPVAAAPFEGRLLGMTPEGAFQIQGADGAARVLAQEELVSLELGETNIAPPKGSVRVTLASGDEVVGTIDEGNFDEVTLSTRAAGSFSVFLEAVLQVVWLDSVEGALELPARPHGPLAPDELFLLGNGRLDRLPGEVVRLDRTGVVFDYEGGKDRLFSALNDKIVAVRLAALGDKKEASTDLLCVAAFRDGTRLTGRLSAGPAGEMKLALTVGPTVTLDRRLLGSLRFKNVSFSFLSDLEPEAVEEVPFLEGGPTFGLLRDRGFGSEDALRIGEERYRKGIALHARSRVTWRIDGRYARFRAEVGVDPMTRDRPVPGSARLRLLADGKEIWTGGLLVAGQKPQPIDVTGLSEAATFSVEADFGDSFGTGARVVLGKAILLK